MSSEKQLAVTVQNLHKTFKLPHEQASGVKQVLISFANRKKGYEQQSVLRDVSFEIKQGEFFGIVGRNGSGKSTLLKLLAGIYTPDEGLVQVNGSLTPFIELGVGFNPELTGRENVFLNGALLGFGRKEMEAMYDEIVEFAELERFMDQKLKNYSSGMQVRLAFSIAIRANSDILLLDEVLAVGDEAFQKKSIAVFEKYKARKQTIILVTHDMSVVERFCTRALMIDKGEVVKIGNPTEVAKLYSGANESRYLSARQIEEEKKQKRIENGITIHSNNKQKAFESGDTFHIEIEWRNTDIKNVGIALLTQAGQFVYGVNTIDDKVTVRGNMVQYDLKLDIGRGEYNLTLGFFGDTPEDEIEYITEIESFTVKSSDKSWGGVAHLSHKWYENDSK